jgi:hypothetical protein
MRRKPPIQSRVELLFDPTPDGLVLGRVVLHAANADAEKDLRRFLARFRDPAIDLSTRAMWERL